MGVIDRTEEFRQLIGASSVKDTKQHADRRTAEANVHSMSNIVSAEIGSQIHQATLNVQELRKLTKLNGNFNDTTLPISRLTASIKGDIAVLEQKINELEQHNCKSHDRLDQTLHRHSSNVVKTLNARLRDVTKDFQDVLEDSAKSLDKKFKRQELLGHVSMKPQPISGADYDFDHRQSSQQVLAGDHHLSRLEAVQRIRSTIADVAVQFQRMTVLVRSQDEQVQSIYDDVGFTLREVEQGQSELLIFFRSISSNRSLILKVFLILIFFVVFFVCFLA